jgi:hypothetical protein
MFVEKYEGEGVTVRNFSELEAMLLSTGSSIRAIWLKQPDPYEGDESGIPLLEKPHMRRGGFLCDSWPYYQPPGTRLIEVYFFNATVGDRVNLLWWGDSEILQEIPAEYYPLMVGHEGHPFEKTLIIHRGEGFDLNALFPLVNTDSEIGAQILQSLTPEKAVLWDEHHGARSKS